MTTPADKFPSPGQAANGSGANADDAPSRSWVFPIILCLLLSVGGWLTWSGRLFPGKSAQEMLHEAHRAKRAGEYQKAEELARQSVDSDESLDDARMLLAKLALRRNAVEDALRELAQITDEQSEQWAPAKQLAAETLHYRSHRFREAEQAYRDVLDVQPDHAAANDGYARLLSLCGRRRDAIPHVLRLIRSGEDTDLLIMLSQESGAVNDPDMLAGARKADPEDPNPLLGQAQAAVSAQDAPRALRFLREAAKLDGLPNDFHGRLGRQLLANEKLDKLNRWRTGVSEHPESFETWMVLGELAERAGNTSGAIRCYWEAVKRRPESMQAMNRLAQKLASHEQPELAEPFRRRVRQLNELREQQQITIMSNTPPDIQDAVALVRAYRAVGRLWETLAWARLALESDPHHKELLGIAADVRSRLPNLELQMTAGDFNPAYRVDLSQFPIPAHVGPSPKGDSNSTSRNISFRHDTQDVGFRFQYYDGTDGTTYRMFEFAGGGIAVLDFDNDGAPDIFCTQGREWGLPASTRSRYHDRIFQNQHGLSFRDISAHAGFKSESGFGQGAAAGDVNNDGFTDLYVANTGANTLWINNGDGTFSDQSTAFVDRNERWTTSCLIADLNGDSVPDLYDVNYLSGDDVFDRVCEHEDGGANLCMPQEFPPAIDCVWLGDGAGGFQDATKTLLSPQPNGKGLGVAALNLGDGRLSVFVANDTTANFLYAPDASNASSLTESAQPMGLAFSKEGRAQACMGIAVGDCTGDERLDLLVTNFLHEYNTLYSPADPKFFADRTHELGLHAATLPVLGFGTQFLDANLDGRLEAFIANGYTHDLSKRGVPYKMVPQFFEWTGAKFAQLTDGRLGPWINKEVVGRAVAKLDWNLDLKPDLAVGLLEDPSFLLTNTSAATENRSLVLQLIATNSARDAIGTSVTATIGKATRFHQLTAGDGYQASNERRIHIGCGKSDQIDRLRVVWPSGEVQEFNDIPISRSLILIEGRELLEGP